MALTIAGRWAPTTVQPCLGAKRPEDWISTIRGTMTGLFASGRLALAQRICDDASSCNNKLSYSPYPCHDTPPRLARMFCGWMALPRRAQHDLSAHFAAGSSPPQWRLRAEAVCDVQAQLLRVPVSNSGLRPDYGSRSARVVLSARRRSPGPARAAHLRERGLRLSRGPPRHPLQFQPARAADKQRRDPAAAHAACRRQAHGVALQ